MTTGIVRRIDNLGRIVIPKEIRKTLKVNEGDSLEIFVDNNVVMLKKYSELDNLLELSSKLVDVFYKTYKKNILITDKDKVIVTSKKLENEYLNRPLSSVIRENILDRSEHLSSDSIIVNGKIDNYFLIPIITNSDLVGSVVLLEFDDNNLKDTCRLISNILIKNIEE